MSAGKYATETRTQSLQMKICLPSSGEVVLTIHANPATLSAEDREFIAGLMDIIRDYQVGVRKGEIR